MKLYGYLLVFTFFAVLSVQTGCGGGGTEDGNQNKNTPHELREALSTFMLHDNFEPEAGSVYFRPLPCPSRIRDYVLRQYERDKEIRSMMVMYFLRYDGKLLSRGLLSADFRKGDLIAVLWEKEAARGFGQKEKRGQEPFFACLSVGGG
jgi:hypothetical protein